MKVAFVSFDFGEYSVRLASALAREAEVLLVLPEQLVAPHRGKLAPTVRLHSFQKPRLRQPVQQLRMLGRMMTIINRFNPDVVHLQQGHPWFNLMLPLLGRRPLVVTVHDPRHHVGDREGRKHPQSITDYGFRRAARLIVHGGQLKDEIIARLNIPADGVAVIPHIVLGDDREQHEIAEDPGAVLFFGRIWEYKGLEYLIRAEPLITSDVPSARIVIAGEGEDFGRYRALMAHPEHFVVHNEYIADDTRTELFRRASVVVLPYIDASQSGVIPLAYTYEKPVVATTVGALPAMVEHGQTGFLVAPKDERALAEAVVRLLKDTELRRRFGANGKRKIDDECGAETVARQTLEVYRQSLHGEPMLAGSMSDG